MGNVTSHTELGSYRDVVKVLATHCCVCRRRLTDAESVEHGIGPICSRRYYDPLFTPTQEQVMEALGALAQASTIEGLIPEHVTDAVVARKANAREACNILIYWASAHYEDKAVVFACSSVIRDFGYTSLADKLEEDRTKVTLRFGKAEDTSTEDTFNIFVPYHRGFVRDMTYLQGTSRIAAPKQRLGWAVPKDQQAHLEAIIGVHFGKTLASVSAGCLGADKPGIVTIRQRTWADLSAFRAPSGTTVLSGSNPAVRIEDNGGPTVTFVSPYNAGWIDAFKKAVPYSSRKWTGSTWKVSRAYIQALKDLAQTHFNTVL